MATFEIILREPETIGSAVQHIRQQVVADYYVLENHEAGFYQRRKTSNGTDTTARVASFPSAAYLSIMEVFEDMNDNFIDFLSKLKRARVAGAQFEVKSVVLNDKNEPTGLRLRGFNSDNSIVDIVAYLENIDTVEFK